MKLKGYYQILIGLTLAMFAFIPSLVFSFMTALDMTYSISESSGPYVFIPQFLIGLTGLMTMAFGIDKMQDDCDKNCVKTPDENYVIGPIQ